MTVDPSDLTDDELFDAIDQLRAEAAMGDPVAQDDLDEHQREADERGL